MGAGRFAGCPITEGALVRFLVRKGESAQLAGTVVERLRTSTAGERWPDELSYADIDLSWVAGHPQVTNAYLVGLARYRSAVLATLDQRLYRAHPEGVELVG